MTRFERHLRLRFIARRATRIADRIGGGLYSEPPDIIDHAALATDARFLLEDLRLLAPVLELLSAPPTTGS